MVWVPQKWLIEHIYSNNLSNLSRNEWEIINIVWSFAATTAQKSSGGCANNFENGNKEVSTGLPKMSLCPLCGPNLGHQI